jgi:hypothetical protein
MQDGDRVLSEAEWALFRTGLDLLRNAIEDDIEAQTDHSDAGVRVFDRLTPEQKLALLADTARALRDAAIATPRHTAVNEGTIAAVFSLIRAELEAEFDIATWEGNDERPTEIRRLLRAVGDESAEREEPLPAEAFTGAEEWDWLLEEFEGRIFWDADYEMGDEFLDLPRDEVRAKLQFYGIDPDYYLTVPDEPDEAGLVAARQTLARLLDLPVPGDDGLYPALEDLYHSLTIGPCSREEIAAWEGNPWIQVIGMAEPGWDCAYPTWMASLSRALPSTPFQLSSASAEAALELSRGIRAERRGEAWVVRDEHGWYWGELVQNGWTGDPADEDMPVLSFPTEAAARAAIAQADRMYGERENRRQQAMTMLELSDD